MKPAATATHDEVWRSHLRDGIAVGVPSCVEGYSNFPPYRMAFVNIICGLFWRALSSKVKDV